jgi:hypothetical protein
VFVGTDADRVSCSDLLHRRRGPDRVIRRVAEFDRRCRIVSGPNSAAWYNKFVERTGILHGSATAMMALATGCFVSVVFREWRGWT